MGVYVDGDVWVEWLDHYVHHCRAYLRTREVNELAAALERGVNNTDWLSRTVESRTAQGGRRLVDFLAGIESNELRESLPARMCPTTVTHADVHP